MKNWTKILVDDINKLINQTVNTAIPAIITKVDDVKKMKVSVKIAVNKMYSDGQIVEYPEMVGVPLMIPNYGNAIIKPPIKSLIKMPVLLIFCQRAIGGWLVNGEILPPNDKAKYSIKDAIAIPGLMPFVNNNLLSDNEDFEIIYKNQKIVIKENDDIDIEAKNVNINLKSGGKFSVAGSNFTVDA